jgi:valyl-tRNA synthetase
LEQYYPTSVLVTGFDIIFFWVARMMMMGMHFMKEIPFNQVYIHALVRDAKGQKMSKSKGNVIDPVALIENYGADALRFTLARLAAPGRDIKLSEDHVVMGRNFATKLWNATRYLMMNECRYTDDFALNACQHPVNRWIVTMLSDLQNDLAKAFEDYRFNDVAGKLYHFAWDVFCDWYIEFTKPLLMGADETLKQETRATLGWVLGQLCHLLHPVKPFLTEELWQAIGGKGLLIEAAWPDIQFTDVDAQRDLNWVVQVISDMRALRAEMNIPAGAKLKVIVKEANAAVTKRLEEYEEILCRLGRLESITLATDHSTKDMLQLIVDGGLLLISLEGIIDRTKEKERLAKEMAKVEAELKAVEAKLNNPQIMAKAPGHIIEEYQERQRAFLERRVALEKALRVLGHVLA